MTGLREFKAENHRQSAWVLLYYVVLELFKIFILRVCVAIMGENGDMRKVSDS